jgi:hypothetical protein
MTTTAELREFLDADPFVPFRLILSSGDAYDVRDPGARYPHEKPVVNGVSPNQTAGR